MKRELTIYRPQPAFGHWQGNATANYRDPIVLMEPQKILPEILFVTSFPPRECGIATYTQDLVKAIKDQFEQSLECAICAVESNSEEPVYKVAPKYRLNTDVPNSYAKNAFKINGDENVKLVVIQHEFGFFAAQEDAFKQFYSRISKPIVFVFHTVLPNPGADLHAKVIDMAANADSIIVMTENASQLLRDDYGLFDSKIVVIAHGTHLVTPLVREKVKKLYHLQERTVLSTFGLLSSSKSIETTLDALPAVVERYPNILFLVLGKTHPSIVKQHGEAYRNMLESKVKELKLEENVRFVNEYLPLPTLLEYLQLSDLYLFTSKDPNQAVSGTFSYAMSCGCPIISTPIPHAKEVLGDNNGMIVDFQHPAQLSAAILSLLDNEALRAEISSNSFHKMASTAWQNSAIAHTLLFEGLMEEALPLHYKVPPINLRHVKKMTTDKGMIQFSKISIPDLHSGYTLDDNARALIAICQHYELTKNTSDFALIDIYLRFIKHCLQEDGSFLNYVDDRQIFTAGNFSENLEDSNGRAIWALGYVVSLREQFPIYLTTEAEELLKKALPTLEKMHSTRAMAFIIKGLHYQNNPENRKLIQTFANRLVQMYKHEKSEDWHWFENYLTYGNSLLPEALLCAYLTTGNTEYREIAKESFDFLMSKIFVNGKIKVISNKGWHVKDSTNESTVGGEQPIDVAYTIMALEKFYTVYHSSEYKRKMIQAFNWFLGDNHLNQIVYNPCTGGCYDGVEEFNVNLNQGAESTLSYLLARLSMERVHATNRRPAFVKRRKETLLSKTKPQQFKASFSN